MSEKVILNDNVKSFLAQKKLLLINGNWQESQGMKTLTIENPANGESITQVQHGSQVDIDLAVKAARKAFDFGPWRTMTPSERSMRLWKLADLIEQHSEEFANLKA